MKKFYGIIFFALWTIALLGQGTEAFVKIDGDSIQSIHQDSARQEISITVSTDSDFKVPSSEQEAMNFVRNMPFFVYFAVFVIFVFPVIALVIIIWILVKHRQRVLEMKKQQYEDLVSRSSSVEPTTGSSPQSQKRKNSFLINGFIFLGIGIGIWISWGEFGAILTFLGIALLLISFFIREE